MQQNAKEFFRKNFVLQGRIFHPKILKPEARKPGDPLKYSVMFAWPKNSNAQVMQELNGFLQQAMQNFFPGVPQQFFIQPIKDYDTYMRQDGKPNPDYVKGHFWVNASSGEQFPPAVVGYPDRQPVMSEAEVYSGRNAALSISFYPINNEKKGIGVNINAVMLLDGGEQVSSGVDVNQIFGAFQADMGLAAQGGQAPVAQPMQQPAPQAQPMQQWQPQQAPVAQPMQQPVQQPVQQPAPQAPGANPFEPQQSAPNQFAPNTNNPYV